MKGASVLFFDPDARVVRAAERALIATGSEVEGLSDERACLERIDSGRHDLLLVNFDPPIRNQPRWLEALDRLAARSPRPHLVLHIGTPTEDALPILAKRRSVRNLIARDDGPLDAEELIVTAEKLLRRDLFGLEKYLLWGVQPYHLEIRDSRRKHEYVDQVARYAERLGCNERTVELVETIVDELVTNAIFDAPRGPDGRPKYADRPRRERVVLEGEEVADLYFACDGDFIAVSQSDCFGALTQDAIIDYLNRCLIKGPGQMTDSPGGAGIGLYRVFNSLSKLIVNLAPGRKTEVICLVDLRVSMKRFRQQPKSLHIFVADDLRPGDVS